MIFYVHISYNLDKISCYTRFCFKRTFNIVKRYVIKSDELILSKIDPLCSKHLVHYAKFMLILQAVHTK